MDEPSLPVETSLQHDGVNMGIERGSPTPTPWKESLMRGRATGRLLDGMTARAEGRSTGGYILAGSHTIPPGDPGRKHLCNVRDGLISVDGNGLNMGAVFP